MATAMGETAAGWAEMGEEREIVAEKSKGDDQKGFERGSASSKSPRTAADIEAGGRRFAEKSGGVDQQGLERGIATDESPRAVGGRSGKDTACGKIERC